MNRGPQAAGLKILAAALLLALSTASLNLLWLAGSTVRIVNASNRTLDSVGFMACGAERRIGRLRAGEAVFRWLPACGDDTLEILVGEARFCRIYVEGELYHVDAGILAADRVECSYDHLFSSLFVVKVLW